MYNTLFIIKLYIMRQNSRNVNWMSHLYRNITARHRDQYYDDLGDDEYCVLSYLLHRQFL